MEFILATDIIIPNISIYRTYVNGNQTGYRANANEGYVFYDKTANDVESDPDTGMETPVTYYYTIAILPLNINFDNFPFVAVPRDSVDENYIFGVGDNDHEVM
jgi:hypothetical protein